MLHPVQYTFGAQIGISGAPIFTQNNTNVWAMPAGDKNMIIGDIGETPAPANLFDAQRALRAEQNSWVILAWPLEGFLSRSNPIFKANANAAGSAAVESVRFHINNQLVGTATMWPWELDWDEAVPGRHLVQLEMLDSNGQSTWSREYRVVVGERQRIEHNDPAISYSGPWNTISHPEFSAGQARLSDGVGDRHFELVFRGTRVRWFTRQNNNGQNVTITLNGIEVATTSVHGGQTYFRHLGWDSGELPEGIYTLRIRTNSRLLLDHLEITSTDGATGEPIPPLAPANLVANAISATEIDLLWTRGSSNEFGFRIERRQLGSTDWQQISTVGAAFTSYSDIGLSHGTTYEYRVQGFNPFGDSPWSDIASATTPEPISAPQAPGGLQASAVSSTRVDLQWINNATDHTGFQLQRMGPEGQWQQIAAPPPNVTSWIDLGLAPNTNYSYRIRAVNNAGASAFSNQANIKTPAPTEQEANIFARDWFIQSLDGTGNLTVNLPDHVAFTGTTDNQYRGAVAAFNESTTLSEPGDSITLEFSTQNVTAGNNSGYTIRFGLFDDNDSPVTENFSNASDGSTGFFVATGNRTSSGRPTSLYLQDNGTAQILGRGRATALTGNGITQRQTTNEANAGNRTAILNIERIENGAVRMSLNLIDAGGRALFLTDDIPAAAVPTYTFNQIAVSLGGQTEAGMDFRDIVVRRGGPSFDQQSPTWNFSTWQTLHFDAAQLTDPTVSGALADPSGYGIANIQRYVFGLNPWEDPHPFMPTPSTETIDNESYLILRYFRDQSVTDVLIQVEASTDLSNWTLLTDLVEIVSPPEPTDRENVYLERARLNIPLNSDTPVFLRLSVRNQP
ncbi:MAG: fibronectin type III domain-containing protein [Verrucomicrobia bacterium]|nr:fibronectin type III domain-containing protein [Verrucomicrobiota bacterium]